MSRTAFRRPSPAGYPAPAVAAVAQEANFAWAATEADSDWELRRTPPLPEAWPPPVGGGAVWFCFAERMSSPGTVEVAAPWARITLTAGLDTWPVVERLSEVVQSLGVQAIQPLDPDRIPAKGPLLEALHRGDPDGNLAKALYDWRSYNGLAGRHAATAPHLPPA